MHRILLTVLGILLTALARGADAPAFHQSTPAAVAQAHAELWADRVDSHGIILDFVGALPTPEDCTLGKPNAIGWWSPIENGPMFTGLYLPAACERARRTGDPEDKAKARRLAQGLLKCASVSDVPGFIARGVGTDGRCHYPLGSDDQTHPWFLGLHAYWASGIPTEAERREIATKMKEVADVLESTGWRCPADGAFKGDFRGGFRGHLFRDACRYLYMLRAMHEVTGDPAWLERYRKAMAERPGKDGKTRLELCNEGYARDREEIARLDESQQWIYVGCQASLARLAAMETDAAARAPYRAGLLANARESRNALLGFSAFDNQDSSVFGNADWRAVYSTWFPQPTQADAERLAKIADKEKRGQRKYYEARLMQNPLAAAAIVALAGEESDRHAIESAIRHYDYSKVHLSTFLLAEYAYHALPAQK